MNQNFSRRNFIKNAALATGGILLVPNFISCSSDDDFTSGDIDFTGYTNQNFNEGVASFDPTQSQVIIWTRYTTNLPSITLIWQIATDADFTTIIRDGEVITDSSRDFTAAVEIQNLDADLKLYYRFINTEDESTSPIGETITLPTGNVNQIKLGVTSCANYAAGLFTVYNAMANSDLDIIVHLGDYIYEYGENEYGTNEYTTALGRTHSPTHETISLDDYRTRYKQYRSDENLKLLHQKKPFICVWDDHEISNDTYKDGAENHQSDEGSFETRKQSALQAYSEYLPAKTNDISIIYRSFQIGDLVNLVMLDTRLIGRDKQLVITDYFDATGSFDAATFQQEWLDTSRTILGTTQKNWLLNEVSGNSAEWQVIGQQVLMGKMMVPAELLMALTTIIAEITATGSASATSMASFQQQLEELVTLKLRVLANDPSLTEIELARINTVLPYNLDAWDGYPAEREIILEAFADKKVVVLAGDTHNAWSNEVTSNSGNVTVTEFATSSVSSPGFDTYLGSEASFVAGFQQAITILIDDLNYFDSARRGYMEVTFSPGSATSNWIFVDTVFSETYSTQTGNTVTV
ncbi:alkaline phosphatase D family protein [Winogradskyella sp. PAMC22761]|nr:alkaline phosphatase D family protein [Winogradskyella sp. PAMC22761]